MTRKERHDERDAGPVALRTLLEELRSEGAAERARVGGSGIPRLEEAHEALRQTRPPPSPVLSTELAELADPGGAELRSHRRWAGRLVLGAKRILQRLLTAELARQRRFHREALQTLADLERRGSAALDLFSARLGRAEVAAAAVAGRLAPAARVFDYAAFEATFRGASVELGGALDEVVRLLAAASAAPVLDLGCGSGDLLERLRVQRIEARGVDLDPAAVAAARARGLDVGEGDLLEGLLACEAASLGAVVSLQVIEHLSLGAVRALFATARRRLRPGGLLVLETVHVASGYGLTHGWSIDPTHRQRLHPRVLRAFALREGFERVEVQLRGAVEAPDRLEQEATCPRLDWLFAPQDVRLVAQVPCLV